MRDTFRKLMDLLDARERRNLWVLLGLMLFMGLANMAGVASVAPFLAVLARPDIVEETPALAALYRLSGAERPIDFLLALGVGAVLAYFLGLAVKAGTNYALSRFVAMRNHSISNRILERYYGQPYAWFLGRHSADLTRTVLGETQQVVSGVLMPVLNLISNGMLTLFLLALLVLVDPWIALFLGVMTGAAYAAVYLAVRRRVARYGREALEANKQRFRAVQEGLRAVKEVKVLGLEGDMLRLYAAPSLRNAKLNVRRGLLSDLPRQMLEGITFGGMMAVVLVLAFLNDGDLARILPVAGVYALAGSRISPAMQQVYNQLGAIRFGKASLDNLHAHWIAAPPPPGGRLPEPIRLRGRLALEGVRFAYPGSEAGALDGLDLEIPANASVGIVGGTGAGKTTAIDLIMGLLEPQAGRLTVDGRPIESDAERRAWRRSVGYVPQQIQLVDASVAENVAFGRKPEEIDMAAVERAARLAQLHRFATEELPQGYATRIGDAGLRLSGGQRQRVGIARALYHDPDVLVLDEATSALDNLTERALMEAVGALGGTKTVIMIAHRLTTVMTCDRIYLLEKGRVAAVGTYEELLETSPAFRAMAQGVALEPQA